MESQKKYSDFFLQCVIKKIKHEYGSNFVVDEKMYDQIINAISGYHGTVFFDTAGGC